MSFYQQICYLVLICYLHSRKLEPKYKFMVTKQRQERRYFLVKKRKILMSIFNHRLLSLFFIFLNIFIFFWQCQISFKHVLLQNDLPWTVCFKMQQNWGLVVLTCFFFAFFNLFISREKLNHLMEMKFRVLMKSYMFKYQLKHLRKLMQRFLLLNC